jgi:hypothetical protein
MSAPCCQLHFDLVLLLQTFDNNLASVLSNSHIVLHPACPIDIRTYLYIYVESHDGCQRLMLSRMAEKALFLRAVVSEIDSTLELNAIILLPLREYAFHSRGLYSYSFGHHREVAIGLVDICPCFQ